MYKRQSTHSSEADRLCDQLREEQQKSNVMAAKEFLESTLDIKLESDDLHKELQNGVLLCRLINCLKPGTILAIGQKNMPFVQMANISLFLQGARELGLLSSDLFQTVDLYEAKDMGAVVNTILSLARLRGKSISVHDGTQHSSVPSATTRKKRSLPRLVGGTARSQYSHPSSLARREKGGYRHVKTIFGQQPDESTEIKTISSTRAVHDISRISEKAEALRQTYRSNRSSQKPTTDSGYSTMTMRGRGICNSTSTSTDTSTSSSSATEVEGETTDTGSDREWRVTQQEETRLLQRSSTGSMITSTTTNAHSSTDQEHVASVISMMQDDNRDFVEPSQLPQPQPMSSRSTPAQAPQRPRRQRIQRESSGNLIKRGADHRASKSDTHLPDSQHAEQVVRIVLHGDEGQSNALYQLGNCIGKGQFGAVYRALDVQTGEVVAVKRIRIEDEDLDQEIMQEVELLKTMDDPNIVRYLGSVRDEEYLNIVLEYVENGSLLSTLKAFGSLPEKLVASYTRRILSGLAYLHEHEVAHCDLKAANILSTKTGEVKLTDFGVSLNLRVKQDELGAPAGTPNWMAPEVIELKGASTKSDIWSLACTIIELLTGKPPYAGMIAMSALYHIVEDDCPPIPEGISESLRGLLIDCFRKDPAERPTAKELLRHEWITPDVEPTTPPPSAPFADEDDDNTVAKPKSKRPSVAQRFLDDDIDLSMIYEYMRANPTMDSQRVPATHIRRKEFIEHQFVKTSFGKAVSCKVCMITVKKHAVYCEACALICHDKCRGQAASCRPIYPTVKPSTPRRGSLPLLDEATDPRQRSSNQGNSKFQKMLASLYL
ncbi:kinase-like domain-containing protein [Syncephalastrum racemosum]|uniref:Kinase-like domain-containing protein n=1 Tax=Syncephalastrum racemosum TaxID=13706 RepID=A0A1X2HU19_SYNRA|nr:kinase-like domain-containing protein [Syncephalastrum racemosum]